MFADMALLAGLAAAVTLVSWRSHRVERVAASASAAEAVGLSEAIGQGNWVRALWSEMVLGLSALMAGTRKRTRKAVTTIHTTKQSAPVRIGGVLLIWSLSEKTYPDHRCSCDGSMERRCMPDVKKRKCVRRVRRVKSPLKLLELVDETLLPVTSTPTVT